MSNRTVRRALLIPIAACALLALAGCENAQTTNAVDGDTIDTAIGRVRVIGIDTPEVGEPCYAEAKERTRQLVVGGEVEILIRANSEDVDRYGRKLRTVIIRGVGDLGEILIREGLANARYDSYDGYSRHDNQGRYRLFDLATPHRCGPDMDSVGGDLTSGSPSGSVDAYYANCDAARAAGAAPLHAGQPGYRPGLDRDGDGIACEWS